MDKTVPISEARANLGSLIDQAQDEPIFILRHGRPAGVLISVDAYERAIEALEDIADLEAAQAALGDPTHPFTPSAGAVAV